MRLPSLRAHVGKVTVILGLLIALNLVALFLITRPRVVMARDVNAATADLAARVERARERLAKTAEIAEEAARRRESLEKFYAQELATKRERLVALQREIHRIATTFQVQTSQIQFNHEGVANTDLVRLTVDMPLLGGYNNLRQFIHEVESSKLFFVVESVQLQKGDQGGVMLSLNVRLATYFVGEGDLSHLREGLGG
jgi:Tfp pilus assembly protein PilO